MIIFATTTGLAIVTYWDSDKSTSLQYLPIQHCDSWFLFFKLGHGYDNKPWLIGSLCKWDEVFPQQAIGWKSHQKNKNI